MADEIWTDLAVPVAEREIAARLVTSVEDNLAELDKQIETVATNWRLMRMAVVDRSVLRLAAAEMVSETAPVRVVIKEAMRLAERYGTSQSAQFVNGVLDALARRLHKL